MLDPVHFEALLREHRYLDLVHSLCEAFHSGADEVIFSGGERLKIESLKLIAEVATDGESLLVLGEELWSQDSELEAIGIFEFAAGLGEVAAFSRAGETLHWMGYFEKSISYLRRAIEYQVPEARWLEGLLGEALVDCGEISEALVLLERAYLHYSEFGIPLAKILLNRGESSRAQDILELLCNENVYSAPLLLGNLYEERGDYDRAIAAYKAGIGQDDAHSAYNLGLVYREIGNLTDAAEAFATARRLGDLTLPPPL